ncbi:MAG: lipocalin-like domain-containing protein [Patescibacteria group bacterium]|nr:lipocalin-like domain-containing protein [Patescibacteria group bacterium]
MRKEFQPIKFPEDESSHDCIVEWWYFNGNLKDKSGHDYSFMDCLFKVDVKKVKIPYLSKIPLKTSYFSHSLVSDINHKKFYHKISPFSIVSADSFSKPLLYINYLNPELKNSYINCAIEKTGKATYHIKNEYLDLEMSLSKKPLLEGGKGFLKLNSKASYYYSLTNLKTEGRIKIKDKWIDVAGKSWMDHQWADVSHSKYTWDWFSIQLEDDTEIVCYKYDDGKVKIYSADISYPNNKQENHKKIEIVPFGRSWTSPKSQAVYPLEWNIKIPAKNINLNLKAKIKNQEMLFGAINYWEGPLHVEGIFDGKKSKGVGFMELVGYPSQYSNAKYIRDEINRTTDHLLSIAKDQFSALRGKKA